jgi:hypothetical protein
MEFLACVVREAGPVIGVFLFFVWRDYMRERDLWKQVSDLQNYQRKGFERLLKRSNLVQRKSIAAIREILLLVDYMRKHPIVLDKDELTTKIRS